MTESDKTRQGRKTRAREALLLASTEGLTLRECASAIGCSPAGASWYLGDIDAIYRDGRWFAPNAVPVLPGEMNSTYHEWLREDVIRRNPPRETDPTVEKVLATAFGGHFARKMGDI